jgi:predicted short-subunit dehydrogenase-like oxidoreductase (DUF2520 family)
VPGCRVRAQVVTAPPSASICLSSEHRQNASDSKSRNLLFLSVSLSARRRFEICSPEAGFCYACAMPARPNLAIIGSGNLGSALARSLQRAGYTVDFILAHSRAASLPRARKLAREVGARAVVSPPQGLRAEIVWFTVPDAEIGNAAQAFANAVESKPQAWKGKIALHSSGALSSDELAVLRRRGAVVASAHPLMTFVRGSRPSFAGVPFALEGDRTALRAARRIVRDLGGLAYPIRKQDKAAYHAWGTFVSPLFTVLLATSERVATLAGVKKDEARRRMIPILLQTLANYATLGAPGAFSGPIVRGDVATVKKHLRVLRKIPAARNAYVALARSACQFLPTKNRAALIRILDSGTSARRR